MAEHMRKVRPADFSSAAFRAENDLIHIREISSVQKKPFATPCLWIFGNRRYLNGTVVAYKSVAIKVLNFSYYCYLDATDLDHREIGSILDNLNNDLKTQSCPNPILGHTLVNMKRLIGFDYERWAETGSLERPTIKLFLAEPGFGRKLEARLKTPVLDSVKRERKMIGYHCDFDWCDLFVHSNDIRLHGWAQFGQLKLASKKETYCSEEYTYDANSKSVRMVECAYPPPILCATVRIRVGVKKVADEQKATFGPDTSSIHSDKILAIASDVYWCGHHTEIAKIRMSSKNVFLKESDGLTEEQMLKQWEQLMNGLNVDAFVFMSDNQDDLLHLALRNVNLTRFREYATKPNEKKNFPGQFYYNHPSRTVINLIKYMEKMQVKPKFDSYNLLAAMFHPAMYNGPIHADTTSFLPNAAILQSSEKNLHELEVETEILRVCEQAPKIISDSLALSNVCSCDATMIVSRGQQIRCFRRIQHDCHKRGRIINRDQLRVPPLVLPSKKYNSFPEPPKLFNCPIGERNETYDDKWARSVVDPPQDIRLLKIKDPPPVPPLIPVELDAPSTKKQRPAGIFGQEYIPVVKKVKAKPKKKVYPGGYVQDPQSNKYLGFEEMIATLDFSSLYPTIMISERICYCVLAWDRRVLDDNRLTKKYVEIITGESICLITHINGVSVEAILAEVQTDLVKERKRIKTLMEAADEEVESSLIALGLKPNTKGTELDTLIQTKPEWSEKLLSIRATMMNAGNYEKQQLGCKVVANALYGFLGAQKHGLLDCIVLMATVTAIGRWQIKTSGWYVVRYYKGAIIYGDTDSIMIQVPGVKPTGDRLEDWNRAYFEKFTQIASEISDLFPKPQKINMEDLSVRSVFFKQKKNYIKKVYEKPDVFKKLKISGMGFMKRDRCEWARIVCCKIAKYLIDDEHKEIVPLLQSEFKKLSDGLVPLSKLAVSISMKQRSEYKSEHLIQLKLAEKIMARTGMYPQPGSRIMYVVEDNGKVKHCDKGETLDWAMNHKVNIDLCHYVDQIRTLLELLFIHYPQFPIQRLLKECESNISRAKAMRNSSVLNFFKVKPKEQVIETGPESIDDLNVELVDDEEDDA